MKVNQWIEDSLSPLSVSFQIKQQQQNRITTEAKLNGARRTTQKFKILIQEATEKSHYNETLFLKKSYNIISKCVGKKLICNQRKLAALMYLSKSKKD